MKCETGHTATGLFTKEQVEYVDSVPDNLLRSHLLHQVRLRDNMESDRDASERKFNELLDKYKKLAI